MRPWRVLVSCPPLLGSIAEFQPWAMDHGLELVPSNVVQTLSVTELTQLLPTMDGWIAGDDPVTFEVLSAGRAGRLRGVVKWGVGVDNVDFAAAKRVGIPVQNTPGMFGNEVADVAMSYVIGLARHTFEIDRGVRAGRWPKPRGISLQNKVIAVVGLGDIGRAVVRRAQAAEMIVIGYDPSPTNVAEIPTASRLEWPRRIGDADFLVFTCALTSQNRHMLGLGTMELLKPGVRIVNVARGPLIDETLLVDSLRSGRVHSVALDVFEAEPLPAESPLREFDKCIFGSHNASNTADGVRRTTYRAFELLLGMLGHSEAA